MRSRHCTIKGAGVYSCVAMADEGDPLGLPGLADKILYDEMKQCKFRALKIGDDKVGFFSELLSNVGYWITHFPSSIETNRWLLNLRKEYRKTTPIFTLADGRNIHLTMDQFLLLKIGGCSNGPLKERRTVFGELDKKIANHQFFGTRTKKYALEKLYLTLSEWNALINCFNKLVILYGDVFINDFQPSVSYEQVRSYWGENPVKTLQAVAAVGQLPEGSPHAPMADLGPGVFLGLTDFPGSVLPNLGDSTEGDGSVQMPAYFHAQLLRENSYEAGGREDPGANSGLGSGSADVDIDWLSLPEV